MFKEEAAFVNVTSSHVARLAGVSRATVSRHLNGSAVVSADVRARIDAAVTALGYEPDRAAVSLVNQKSRTIMLGFFSHDAWALTGLTESQWYFYLSVLREVENLTRDAGYDLLLPSVPAGEGGAAYVRSLRARRAAGALIAGTTATDPRIGALVEAEVPSVFIDVRASGPCATSVMSDHESGAHQSVGHLVGLGHRQMSVLTGPADDLAGEERLRGTWRAFSEAGLPLHERDVLRSDWSQESGYEAVLARLRGGEVPTAIVAHSDMLALGAMKAVREMGLSVPDDISVIGFDDIMLAQYTHPPLTTVRQDPAAIARASIDALLRMVEGGERATAPLRLPVHLIERGSTTRPGTPGR